MTRFKRHRRDAVTKRLRLRNYDYSSPGAYVVTICAEERLCHFGEIAEGMVVHSRAGVVMDSWWCSIPRQFPGVAIDAWVVMPNHLHGIIVLGTDPDAVRESSRPNLSKVVQWYKGITTKDYILGVKTEGWPRFPGRLWQEGFFEHIVRSDAALERHRAYIEANPAQWSDG